MYSVINPVYGVLFFVHIILLRPENLTWGTAMFGRLHLLTAVAVSFGYLVHRHRYVGDHAPAISQTKNVILFAVFVCWLMVSSAGAEYSSQISFDLAFDIGKIFVICLLFSRLFRDENKLFQYVWVVSISLGALSFWGILQGLAGNSRLEDLWGIGTSNVLGALLVLMAPFVLANVLDANLARRHRLMFLGCTLSIVLCCAYTESRGAFLGLAVGILMMLVQLRQRVQIGVVVVLLALLASPWFPESYYNRMATIFAEQGELDASARSRPVLWKIAFLIWRDHPIAGVGLGNFSEEKEKYAGKAEELGANEEVADIIFNTYRVPHSLYFSLLSEVGGVGLALYLVLFARNTLGRLPTQVSGEPFHRLYLQARGAQAGLLGFGVAALFGDFYYIEPLYLQIFWVGAAYDVLWRPIVGSANNLSPQSAMTSPHNALAPLRG